MCSKNEHCKKNWCVFIPTYSSCVFILNLVVLWTSFLRKFAASRATATHRLSKWLKLSAPRAPCNTYTWIILLTMSQGYLHWLAQASYTQTQTLLPDILTTHCSLLKLWKSSAFTYHRRKHFVYPTSNRNKVSTPGTACRHASHSRVHSLPLLYTLRLVLELLENFIKKVVLLDSSRICIQFMRSTPQNCLEWRLKSL